MATYNGHNEDASGNILLSIGNGMAATLETGTTASQAYTKGAYLYYNNRLCKVTAAIAKSATLTIGTNIAYTTLGAELTSHLRASNGNELYFDYKDGKPGYYPTASKTASQFVPFGGSTLYTKSYTVSLATDATRTITAPSGYLFAGLGSYTLQGLRMYSFAISSDRKSATMTFGTASGNLTLNMVLIPDGTYTINSL